MTTPLAESAPLASDATCRTQRARFWFETAVVFLVFFVAAGDPPPGVNEAHYLCRLKHFWDPAYCPGDLFLESPDAHFTVVWLFGWVTRLVSLGATAWLGRLLAWGLLAVAWTRLTCRITPRPWMAPLGAAVFVCATQCFHFAGEWVVGGFEAKSLAYGFVLLALADAIDRRWNRAWLLLGAATALHALVGAWSVVALAGAAIATRRLPRVGSMLPGLVGGGVLALAGVLPALQLNVGAPDDIVTQANETYVFFRLPHHLSPLSKDVGWLEKRLGVHLVLVAVLLSMHRMRRRESGEALPLVVAFAWAAEAISLAGLTIEVVLWNDPAWAAALLKYYWFRLADIAAPIAVALLIAQWVGEQLAERRRAAALAAVVLVALCGWRLGWLVAVRTATPFAAGDAVMVDPAAWIEMGDWIAENTPPDAVFLVPLRSHTFKWRAGRAEVVTYKDVPQDARSMVAWRKRYLDVFQSGEWEDGSPRWTPSLGALGAERLRELGAKYGATYALSQAPKDDAEAGLPLRQRASLPIVRQIGPYTLYGLGGPDDVVGSPLSE